MDVGNVPPMTTAMAAGVKEGTAVARDATAVAVRTRAVAAENRTMAAIKATLRTGHTNKAAMEAVAVADTNANWVTAATVGAWADEALARRKVASRIGNAAKGAVARGKAKERVGSPGASDIHPKATNALMNACAKTSANS